MASLPPVPFSCMVFSILLRSSGLLLSTVHWMACRKYSLLPLWEMQPYRERKKIGFKIYFTLTFSVCVVVVGYQVTFFLSLATSRCIRHLLSWSLGYDGECDPACLEGTTLEKYLILGLDFLKNYHHKVLACMRNSLPVRSNLSHMEHTCPTWNILLAHMISQCQGRFPWHCSKMMP